MKVKRRDGARKRKMRDRTEEGENGNRSGQGDTRREAKKEDFTMEILTLDASSFHGMYSE